MPKPRQHRDDPARRLQPALHGLIGIGIAPDMDGLRRISRPGQLLFQKRGGVRLEEQLALEIQARRKAHIGVGGPRITIDAAVLTPPIWVDGLIERDVRTVIAGDDRPRGLGGQGGSQRRSGLVRRPAIVKALLDQRFIAARRIGRRAPATRTWRERGHALIITVDQNKTRTFRPERTSETPALRLAFSLAAPGDPSAQPA